MKYIRHKVNYRRPWRASYLDREAVERYKGLDVTIYIHAKDGVCAAYVMTIGDIDADGYLHELDGNPTSLHLRGGNDYRREWIIDDNGFEVDFKVVNAFDWVGDEDYVDRQADAVRSLDDDELMARYGLTPEQAEILIDDEFGWAEYAENERKFRENYEPDDFYCEELDEVSDDIFYDKD